MPKKSSNSAKIRLFKLNLSRILNSLKTYGERAVKGGAKAVILIGSLARGDYTPFSDADLIIISDDVPESIPERIKKFLDPSLPIDVNPFVYTVEEILEMAKKRRRIIWELIRYGKVLAGDENIIKLIKDVFERG